MKLLRVVAAAVASVVMVGSASAADPVMYTPAVTPVTIAAPVPAFSFAGTYIGVTTLEVRTLSVAPLFGFNIVRGRFLAGMELRAGAIFSEGLVGVASATGRAGVILGDRLALYGLAGAGIAFAAGEGFEPFFAVGTGLEFAVTDRISVFGETRALGAFEAPAASFTCCAVQVGVRIHR